MNSPIQVFEGDGADRSPMGDSMFCDSCSLEWNENIDHDVLKIGQPDLTTSGKLKQIQPEGDGLIVSMTVYPASGEILHVLDRKLKCVLFGQGKIWELWLVKE